MSLTYTVFRTETLEGGQVRIYQGYEISGAGVILNMLIKMTIAGKEVRLFDEELFVPGATAAAFSGMTWTAEDTQDLGMGQKRYVRSFSPSTGGKIIELYRTVKQNVSGAFEMVGQAQLCFAQGYADITGAITPISISGAVTYTSSPSWQDMLQYSGGPVLQTTFTLKRVQHLFANLVISAYNVTAGFTAEWRMVLDGNEFAWNKQRFPTLYDDESVGITGIYRNVSAGSHTLKAQVYMNGSEFDGIAVHAGAARGKLEGMIFG